MTDPTVSATAREWTGPWTRGCEWHRRRPTCRTYAALRGSSSAAGWRWQCRARWWRPRWRADCGRAAGRTRGRPRARSTPCGRGRLAGTHNAHARSGQMVRADGQGRQQRCRSLAWRTFTDVSHQRTVDIIIRAESIPEFLRQPIEDTRIVFDTRYSILDTCFTSLLCMSLNYQIFFT